MESTSEVSKKLEDDILQEIRKGQFDTVIEKAKSNPGLLNHLFKKNENIFTIAFLFMQFKASDEHIAKLMNLKGYDFQVKNTQPGKNIKGLTNLELIFQNGRLGILAKIIDNPGILMIGGKPTYALVEEKYSQHQDMITLIYEASIAHAATNSSFEAQLIESGVPKGDITAYKALKDKENLKDTKKDNETRLQKISIFQKEGAAATSARIEEAQRIYDKYNNNMNNR